MKRSSGDNIYQLPAESNDRKHKEQLLTSKRNRNDYSNISWESQQVKRSKTNTNDKNFKNPDEISLPGNEKYEFVFDSKIDFALDSKLIDEISTLKDEKDIAIEQEKELQRQRLKSISDQRKSLPVYKYRDEILDSVQKYQVLILVGETGSGKTTQIPQYLIEQELNHGLTIACTQPRRVAATSVATRVAEEMNVKLGNEVGYTIRFEDKSSDKTILKYLTDGMLLKEFSVDPELSKYSVIMIDEAHERTSATDLILSLLKQLITRRKDLKVIVMSATINASKFSEFFNNAPIFSVPGRKFPVDVYYTLQPEANYVQAALTTIFQIHTTQPKGDILVFLTGQDEIESIVESLTETCGKLGSKIKEMLICPIYANLPPEIQQKIFEKTPENARKVVLATNIAETSITIDGIVYVIDPGFVKENVYNPSTGMEALVITPCSRASVDQRAGRAGRVGPGKCFRLFTKWAYFNELESNPTPEILRSNLSSIVLLLLSMGINDLLHFEFMDPPSNESLIKSLELLYALGAMNDKGNLTKLGFQMCEFPTDPMISKSIISSEKFNCVEEILTIMSMLGESNSLFYRPKEKKLQADQARESFSKIEGGDHLTLLEIYNQYKDNGYSNQWCRDFFLQSKTLQRVKNIRNQLKRICVKLKIVKNIIVENKLLPEQQLINVQKSIVSGFFPHTAKLSKLGDSYKSIKKQQNVFIHPSSILFKVKPPPKLIVYNELVLTSKQYMRNCIPIREHWLEELAPHYFNSNLDKK